MLKILGFYLAARRGKAEADPSNQNYCLKMLEGEVEISLSLSLSLVADQWMEKLTLLNSRIYAEATRVQLVFEFVSTISNK